MFLYHNTIIRLMALTLCMAVTACDQMSQSSSISSQCQPPTGSAFEDGQVEVCTYATDSLEKAYEAIVLQHQGDASAYALLRKTLPTEQVKDSLDGQEVWISYAQPSPTSVKITLQMAGGEDEMLLKKNQDSVIVQTTLSAD